MAKDDEEGATTDSPGAVLTRSVGALRTVLHDLATAVTPFPGFLGMESVQGIELEPAGHTPPDAGCVIVCPDGEVRELVLRMVPGPMDTGGVEQVSEMRDLEITPEDYVAYACDAIQKLVRLL